ncbi:MAG: hypothetical protein R3A47_09725 [Polyangiales bacterium]
MNSHTDSGHYVLQSLQPDLDRAAIDDILADPIYHIKPVFEQKVLRELAEIRSRNIGILQLDDQFLF